MKKQIAVFLLSIMPIVSHASGESCNALFNVGLYNTTLSSSATDAQALGLSTFCSADYSQIDQSSSQALAVRGSYLFGFISGGGGGSASSHDIVTKQSQLCTSGFNSSAYSNRASSYSNTIYQGALDAWNKCQQLANQGLVFSVQPSSTMQGMTVSITAPTGLSATYYGVTQYGSGTSNCTTMANGKVFNASTSNPFKFTAASKVTVTCKRNMLANGSDLSADAQDLVFVTSADNLTVPLSAVGSFSRVTADSIINTANQNAQSLVNQTTVSLAGAIVAFNSISCPNGWRPADGTNRTLDLRGEFLRGLDNGRGVDSGRVLASWQAPTLTTTAIGPDVAQQAVVEGSVPNTATVSDFNSGMQTDSIDDSWYGNALRGSIYTRTAYAGYSGNSINILVDGNANRPLNNNQWFRFGGTRPRNVAVLYCVKN